MPAQIPVSSSRIAWIDEFKGLVLILVCIFHVDQHFQHIDVGSFHLACLRMAAFFFISGVLFSNRRFPKFKDYLKHKTKVLLLPYIMLSLFFLLFDPVIYNFDFLPFALRPQILFNPVEVANVWQYIGVNLENIFVEGKGSIMGGTLWFVSTLYFISLMFFLLQSFATRVSERVKIAGAQSVVIFVFAVLSFCAGYALCLNKVHLPLGVERCLSTLFYFALGFLCKPLLNRCSALKSKWAFVISIACFVAYALFKDQSPWRGFYNNNVSLALLVSSLFGILGLVLLMSVLSGLKNGVIQKFLAVLRCVSRNGLIVLTVHFWILITCKILFRQFFDRPVIAYTVFALVALVTAAAIPVFRSKLHFLIAKPRISVRESFLK